MGAMRSQRLRSLTACAATIGAALFVASLVASLLSGCYRNVVGVKGPANQSINVTEANVQPGESFWEEEKPRPVVHDRYSGTALDAAKPVPNKKPKPNEPPQT